MAELNNAGVKSKLNELSEIPLLFFIYLMIVLQISSKDKIFNYRQVINYWQKLNWSSFISYPLSWACFCVEHNATIFCISNKKSFLIWSKIGN